MCMVTAAPNKKYGYRRTRYATVSCGHLDCNNSSIKQKNAYANDEIYKMCGQAFRQKNEKNPNWPKSQVHNNNRLSNIREHMQIHSFNARTNEIPQANKGVINQSKKHFSRCTVYAVTHFILAVSSCMSLRHSNSVQLHFRSYDQHEIQTFNLH